MLLQVDKADYLDDYNLFIKFNDGIEGSVNLKETIFNDSRKIFEYLREVDNFKDFQIALNTICWSNNLDLAPEYLKETLLKQNHS